MEQNPITNHEEIIQKLNSYLGVNLPVAEVNSNKGFAKIAKAIIDKQCNNYHLSVLNIDLKSFEQLVRDRGFQETIFCSLSPLVNEFLSTKTQKPSEDKTNPFNCFPDDNNARQQANYS
ncbi:MAG: hypothetical protein WCN88_02125 [Candidatus Falkowbacteria bacterium]